MTTVEALRRTPLFASLTEGELLMLAGRALRRRYKPGEFLFCEGDPCHGLFVLVKGSVKIFKTSPSGRVIFLAVESAPSSVAEVPLFDGGAYPATVCALDEVEACLIGKEDFRKVCLGSPELALKVLAVVGKRLRQLVSLVESVSFGTVRQRLAALLLELVPNATAGPVMFPYTHQELACRLGTVREVISRNLGRFQAEGLIRVEGRKLRILNLAGLKAEAETEY